MRYNRYDSRYERAELVPINLDRHLAINQPAPAPTTSARYGFVNTREVCDEFVRAGWTPTKFSERRSRAVSRLGYGAHFIRFKQESMPKVLGTQTPEIVFFNSHDGLSSCRILFGVFSLICSNGLVVCTNEIADYNVRHNLHAREIVQEAAYNMLQLAPNISNRIRELAAFNLNDDQINEYAINTLPIRFSEDYLATYEINISRLVKPVRPQDDPRNLYGLMNIIQEKYMKGGVWARPLPKKEEPEPEKTIEAQFIEMADETRRRRVTGPRRSRGITSATEDLRLNKDLWASAENFMAAKRAA